MKLVLWSCLWFFKKFNKWWGNTFKKFFLFIFPEPITANQITVGRALLFVPVNILISFGYIFSAFALFVIAAILDSADGIIARERKQESDLGAMLDPVMDKIFFLGLLIPNTGKLINYFNCTLLDFITLGILIIVPIEIYLGIIRYQDYRYNLINDLKKRNLKAGTSGKLKLVLEMVGIGGIILKFQGPFSIFQPELFYAIGIVSIYLSILFAYKSLKSKLVGRKFCYTAA